MRRRCDRREAVGLMRWDKITRGSVEVIRVYTGAQLVIVSDF